MWTTKMMNSFSLNSIFSIPSPRQHCPRDSRQWDVAGAAKGRLAKSPLIHNKRETILIPKLCVHSFAQSTFSAPMSAVQGHLLLSPSMAVSHHAFHSYLFFALAALETKGKTQLAPQHLPALPSASWNAAITVRHAQCSPLLIGSTFLDSLHDYYVSILFLFWECLDATLAMKGSVHKQFWSASSSAPVLILLTTIGEPPNYHIMVPLLASSATLAGLPKHMEAAYHAGSATSQESFE